MPKSEQEPLTKLPADELRESLVNEQLLTNITLQQLEGEWKAMRMHSRNTTIRLIAETNMSVAEASRLSGHHRNTIMVWLQVHNAENSKKLRESKDK